MMKTILVRGGGDLASGVVLRLKKSGFNPIIVELPNPMAVRRTVSFSEAVYAGQVMIENTCGCKVASPEDAFAMLPTEKIPILIDPDASILASGKISAMVDARLLKVRADSKIPTASLVIGLGPGFTCGENCHAVIETQRGHFLGRVYWQGTASADTGQPDGDPRRVLRAPTSGILQGFVEIGEHLEQGQLIAEVGGIKITSPFVGVLRGLIRPGVFVNTGVKIGDVDPRDDPALCFLVSDKALAIGGGVLEALLSAPGARQGW